MNYGGAPPPCAACNTRLAAVFAQGVECRGWVVWQPTPKRPQGGPEELPGASWGSWGLLGPPGAFWRLLGLPGASWGLLGLWGLPAAFLGPPPENAGRSAEASFLS